MAVLAAMAAVAIACGSSADVSRALGAQCEDQDECEDRCLEGTLFPDGFCSLSCDNNSDCPDGGACTSLQGGVCVFTCTDAAECEFLGAGWRCRAQRTRDSEDGRQVMVCVGPG